MSENPKFHVAFNSLLAGSTVPVDALSRSRGTHEMGERSGILVEQLRDVFDEVSVSVIPGRMLDLASLASQFQKRGVTVSSVDVPDVLSIPRGVGQALRNLAKADISTAKRDIGWTLANTGSIRQQGKRTKEALVTLKPSTGDTVQILKANASFWVDHPQEGRNLERVLQQYQCETGQKVGLAIEIWAEGQTPAEYQAFLDRLRSEQAGKDPRNALGIYADIDLGHVELSRARRPDHVIDPAVKILENILSDPKRAKEVRIVSLNQYREGDHIHERLDQGVIDFHQTTRLIGKSLQEEKAENITTLIEAYPFHYDWFMSEEGLIYCQSLQTAFDQGANS